MHICFACSVGFWCFAFGVRMCVLLGVDSTTMPMASVCVSEHPNATGNIYWRSDATATAARLWRFRGVLLQWRFFSRVSLNIPTTPFLPNTSTNTWLFCVGGKEFDGKAPAFCSCAVWFRDAWREMLFDFFVAILVVIIVLNYTIFKYRSGCVWMSNSNAFLFIYHKHIIRCNHKYSKTLRTILKQLVMW